MQYPDFNDVVEQATKLITAGHQVHQKFTCAICGTNQAVSDINMFHMIGTCEECGFETDLVKHGCGYLLVASVAPAH